jgi:hypothetical protein
MTDGENLLRTNKQHHDQAQKLAPSVLGSRWVGGGAIIVSNTQLNSIRVN